MGANSRIEWTHHTMNPWRGCTKVSPGCDHCYAETASKRNPKVLGVWGDDGTRVVASEAYWREPLKWNAAAKARGERHRVFCASLADVAEDRRDLDQPRARLCRLIDETPALIWMLLTKRPENLAKLFPRHTLEKCGVGVTAEDDPRAEIRIPQLLRTPAAWRFVSAEPLLGPLHLYDHWIGEKSARDGTGPALEWSRPWLDWVIVGGESGHSARPCDRRWIYDLIDQCRGAGVPIFVKQLGARSHIDGTLSFLQLADKKGGDPSVWPPDMRVREFPEVPA